MNIEIDGVHILPSQQEKTEPASIAGFRFLITYGGLKRGFSMKHSNWKPPRLSRGKKWYVIFQFRSPATGKFKPFKIYEDINRIKDPVEKEAYGKKLLAAVNYGLALGFDPFQEKEMKVAVRTWTLVEGLNYFKQKLEDRGLRKRTIQSYHSVLRMLYKNMKGVLNEKIDEITKHQIQNALSKNNWSNTTFNNNLTVIRAIFNFLIDAGILQTNPAKKIKLLPETISRHRYFDEKTWNDIKEKSPADLLEFLMFLYHTATRPNEARQLRYEHIKGDQLLMPGSISKNRKADYIPLSKYIQKKYKKGEGFIFGTSVNHFNQKFQIVKKQLKLDKDFTLYSIKHTRAVHMARGGASPFEIKQLFRHSSLDVTDKYLRDLGLLINKDAVEKGLEY